MTKEEQDMSVFDRQTSAGHTPRTCGNYAEIVLSLARYPEIGRNGAYPSLGLSGELGEIAQLVNDRTFNHIDRETYRVKMLDEMGDLLWYIAALASESLVRYSATNSRRFEIVACRAQDHIAEHNPHTADVVRHLRVSIYADMTFEAFDALIARCGVNDQENPYSVEQILIKIMMHVGRASEQVKKLYRDDIKHMSAEFIYPSIERSSKIADALSCALFWLTVLSHSVGYTLEVVAERNIHKLTSRAQRGTIQGEGDNR